MRYSTLASTVLLAVATAPALAHPITNRATEDASMVERELQDALMERGYYYDLLPRHFGAHHMPRSERAVDRAAREAQARVREKGATILIATAEHHQKKIEQSHQPQQTPQQNSGSRQGAGAQHHPREYDLDGEPFGRGFEVDELD
ncbi:uncharacterized protein B0H18DRAFT_503870 [Fomitopsis serialis]|uniref:uncharacterized protein n=1 Tax=Fomitopsis serialis TaxID=139415 RepID=UPI002008C6D5|nr:uncharacterized protein B0H18DRAFT_503870 [Neoantrodia serialis]KAH9922766.1 hypothetical protein B0H18DRAFT_503870 [Neoantrodia serialis]